MTEESTEEEIGEEKAICRIIDFFKRLDFSLRDWHLYGGTILVSVGLAVIYYPLSLIFPGLLLIHVALSRP